MKKPSSRVPRSPDHRKDPKRSPTARRPFLAAEASECVRRLTEEARDVRDRHREALETIRQEREAMRETAETARVASEAARVVAESARQAVVNTIRATADSLNASLARMKIVEDLRRTLRGVRDADKIRSG